MADTLTVFGHHAWQHPVIICPLDLTFSSEHVLDHIRPLAFNDLPSIS
jgi:hypothetical protein